MTKLYDEQCLLHGSLNGRQTSDLMEELRGVRAKIVAAERWGAELAALYGRKEVLEREIRRRGE